MSTDPQALPVNNQPAQAPTDTKPVTDSPINPSVSSNPAASEPIVEMTGILESIDPNSPDAKLNATSIVGADGKRIELNLDRKKANDFEKIIKK